MFRYWRQHESGQTSLIRNLGHEKKKWVSVTCCSGQCETPEEATLSTAALGSSSTPDTMLWSPRLSLSNFHVKLTAKGLFRNLQLLSGCRKNTVVFHAGLDQPLSPLHPTVRCFILSVHPSVCSSSISSLTPSAPPASPLRCFYTNMLIHPSVLPTSSSSSMHLPSSTSCTWQGGAATPKHRG